MSLIGSGLPYFGLSAKGSPCLALSPILPKPFPALRKQPGSGVTSGSHWLHLMRLVALKFFCSAEGQRDAAFLLHIRWKICLFHILSEDLSVITTVGPNPHPKHEKPTF